LLFCVAALGVATAFMAVWATESRFTYGVASALTAVVAFHQARRFR